MAILKKGDWVLLPEGQAGRILIEDYMGDGGKFPLVQVFDGTINTIRHRDCLTPIDPAFEKLLTAVNKESVGG